MNRIVREHYPVAKLPDDLREGFQDVKVVTVTIETLTERNSEQSLVAVLQKARELRREGVIPTITESEAVERVRRLRDE